MDKNNVTKGEWALYKDNICSAVYVDLKHRPSEKQHQEIGYFYKKEDGILAIVAVNACKSVNETDPLAVVQAIPDMVKALKYLFNEYTGGRNYGVSDEGKKIEQVLSRIEKGE